ncbi:MAG: TlpA family protein disulfide reductase, partial [Bacteroidetes bacterium]|nr:TlpA family protein disulfide reductase [Bacteroidota bacterium]
MKVIIRLLLVFLVAVSSLSSAQNVTIKGKAPGYEGQFISIVEKKDYISLLEVINARSLIDENGNFELAFQTDHTIKCVLRIGNVNANIYLVPNKTYEITFPKLQKTDVRTLSNSNFVSLTIENGKDGDLNFLISEFNIYRDDFLYKNVDYFNKGAYRILKAKVDSFKLNANKKFKDKGNAYFKNYLMYGIGELEYARNKSKKDLYDEYIQPHGISYENNQYMNFFSQYYNQRLASIALYNKALVDAINIDESLEKANNALSSELGYNTPKLREAALLFGLFECRNSATLTKNGIMKILQTISETGLTPYHRKVAANIIEKIRKVMVGSRAPEFELSDQNGNLVSLKDFRGRYIYIDFWATWCAPCLREMKMMKSLQNEYGDRIEIISISIDDNKASLQKFLKKN